MSNLNIEQVIGGYLKLRAKKAAIKAEAEAECKTLDEKMEKLELYIREQADQQGVTSFKTNHGTAFLSPVDFANVADWDSVLDFVKTNNAWDMLDKRVNKTAVRNWLNETKEVPPGVNYGTKLEVHVRKPSSKVED